MTLICPRTGEGYVPLHLFWVNFLKIQNIQNILKTIQINLNIDLFVIIYNQFWIETLKLTSGCHSYHRCWWLWYLSDLWKKLIGKKCQVHRWVSPEAWCDSCCHFHVGWWQRWIWAKKLTTMLFLLWTYFWQWLEFMWKHDPIC